MRTRNWASIVYPESAPDKWIDILKESKVTFIISPLHDSDVNADGERKKEHYHVILLFDGVKTSAQASAVFDTVNGVGCEPVTTLRGYARYLCHLDNPEKAQYDINQVVTFGAVDYTGVIGLPTDKYYSIAEMMDFCDRNNIISYAALIRYARDNNEIWFRILCDSGTLVMKEFIKSRTWEVTNGY